MTTEERRALTTSHAVLASALVTIAERAGLADQAAAVASRLALRGLEHDPVGLVALHSEALALIAEALVLAEREAAAAEVKGSRGQVSTRSRQAA